MGWSLMPSSSSPFTLQIKSHYYSPHFSHGYASTNKCTLSTKQNGTTYGLLLFLFFLSFAGNYKQKQHKSLYIACSPPAEHNYQTGCPLRSIIYMIHPDKIKPYSQLHVSMTSLTKFFHLGNYAPPWPIFLSFIGCRVMMTEFYSPPICRGLFSSPLIGHQDTWHITNSPLLITIPGIHSLTCLGMTRSLII